MPDEGTPQGDAPDVNTDAGFYASIAKSTGIDISPETLAGIKETDTSVAGGLEIPESTPQARDEGGRFAPAATPPAETPAEGAAPSGGEDDPLAALVAQYDGDVNAALAAVVQERDNAQSLIGRQGNEVGELREQIARLEGRIDATPPTPQAAPSQFVTEAQIREAIEGSENPAEQALSVMGWVVENAPDMVEDTERIWAEFDPYAALSFRQDRIQYEAEAKAKEGGAPAPGAPADDVTAWVKAQQTREEVGAALEAARAGISDEDWSKLKPVVAEELNAAPAFVKDAINKGDVKTKAEAFKQVVLSAQSRLLREATSTAAEQAAAEALTGKQQAAVLHGAQQPPPEAGGEEERTPETVSKLLRDELLKTETTSVSEGLTYGQPAPGLSGQVR